MMEAKSLGKAEFSPPKNRGNKVFGLNIPKYGSGGTTTSTTQPNPQAGGALGNILTNAQDLYGSRPTAPLYTGNPNAGTLDANLLAGFSPDQYAAMNGIRSMQGAANPFLSQAMQYTAGSTAPVAQNAGLADPSLLYGGYAGGVGTIGSGTNYLSGAQGLINQGAGAALNIPQFSQQNIDQYMSPYLNDVLSTSLKNIDIENSKQTNDLQSKAIGSGAYGGDRAGLVMNDLARQQDLAKNSTIAQILQGGYGSALQALQQQQQTGLQRASALGGFGSQTGNLAGLNTGIGTGLVGATTAEQNLVGSLTGADRARLANAAMQSGVLGQETMSTGLQGINALLGSGTLQQQQQQQALNIPYLQWQQQQAWPYQNLSYLSGITGQVASGLGGTTSTTVPSPSLVSQLGGLGLGALGLVGGTGGFGSNGWITKLFGGGGGSGGTGIDPITGNPLTGGAGINGGIDLGQGPFGPTFDPGTSIDPNFDPGTIDTGWDNILSDPNTAGDFWGFRQGGRVPRRAAGGASPINELSDSLTLARDITGNTTDSTGTSGTGGTGSLGGSTSSGRSGSLGKFGDRAVGMAANTAANMAGKAALGALGITGPAAYGVMGGLKTAYDVATSPMSNLSAGQIAGALASNMDPTKSIANALNFAYDNTFGALTGTTLGAKGLLGMLGITNQIEDAKAAVADAPNSLGRANAMTSPQQANMSPDDVDGPSPYGGSAAQDGKANISPDDIGGNAYGSAPSNDGRANISPDDVGDTGREGNDKEGRDGSFGGGHDTESAGGEGGGSSSARRGGFIRRRDSGGPVDPDTASMLSRTYSMESPETLRLMTRMLPQSSPEGQAAREALLYRTMSPLQNMAMGAPADVVGGFGAANSNASAASGTYGGGGFVRSLSASMPGASMPMLGMRGVVSPTMSRGGHLTAGSFHVPHFDDGGDVAPDDRGDPTQDPSDWRYDPKPGGLVYSPIAKRFVPSDLSEALKAARDANAPPPPEPPARPNLPPLGGSALIQLPEQPSNTGLSMPRYGTMADKGGEYGAADWIRGGGPARVGEVVSRFLTPPPLEPMAKNPLAGITQPWQAPDNINEAEAERAPGSNEVYRSPDVVVTASPDGGQETVVTTDTPTDDTQKPAPSDDTPAAPGAPAAAGKNNVVQLPIGERKVARTAATPGRAGLDFTVRPNAPARPNDLAIPVGDTLQTAPSGAALQAPSPAGAPQKAANQNGLNFSRTLSSPWATLAALGFGLMGGRSPYALTNLGDAGIGAMKFMGQQRQEELREHQADTAEERAKAEQAYRDATLAETTRYHSDEITSRTAQTKVNADREAAQALRWLQQSEQNGHREARQIQTEADRNANEQRRLELEEKKSGKATYSSAGPELDDQGQPTGNEIWVNHNDPTDFKKLPVRVGPRAGTERNQPGNLTPDAALRAAREDLLTASPDDIKQAGGRDAYVKQRVEFHHGLFGKPAASPSAAPAAAAPMKVTGPEDYAKVPPGKTYIDPDGVLRTKPAQ